MSRGRSFILSSLALLLLAPLPAAGEPTSFHLMQIEQVIGGVCGDTGAQVVQLRIRTLGQNLVSGRKLIAYDATGSNPITLITFPSNVSVSNAGSRILVASAKAATALPNRDFVMTATIPASYLAAGRLAFDDGAGTIYWSVSWGGAAYTGAKSGSFSNDADGIFGPAFATRLPSSTSTALFFDGVASDMSTNNAADYALTPGPASFTNNAGTAMALPDCFFGDDFETGGTSLWPAVVP